MHGGQVLDHRVGDQVLRPRRGDHRKRGAAGGPGGFQAGRRVLDDQALDRVDAQPAGCFEIGIRRWLAAEDVVRRDQDRRWCQMGRRKSRLSERHSARGGDRVLRSSQRSQGFDRPRKNHDVVEFGDLQLVDSGDSRLMPVGLEDRPHHARRGHAVPAVLDVGRQSMLDGPLVPGTNHRRSRVDQGAVHVEQHRVEHPIRQPTQWHRLTISRTLWKWP